MNKRLKKRILKINKKRMFFFSLIYIIMFLSAESIIRVSADDNYSTYLYNQDINVAKDSAHLFTETADGSNSYRNIFQSDFLFPAKLQTDMLSTYETSTFSHYSFNQFYFDNLDSEYAYKSNNPTENIYQNDTSINFQEIGNISAEYTFNNYTETYSNYGNYNGTFSFENEIGFQNDSISFVDNRNPNVAVRIINEHCNHKSVMEFNSTENWKDFKNYFDDTISGTIEYWTKLELNSQYTVMLDYPSIYITQKHYQISVLVGDGVGGYYSDDIAHDFTEWTHLAIKFDCTTDQQYIYINNELVVSGNFLDDSDMTELNTFRIVCQTPSGTKNSWIDAIGYSFDDNYNVDDNTNPFGLQNQLENDFDVSYSYGSSIYIIDTNNYLKNALVFEKYAYLSNYPEISDTIDNKENGTIEFLFMSNTTTATQLRLRVYTNIGLSFGITATTEFNYYDGSWSSTGVDFLPDTLYHIVITFDCSQDNWNLTINNNFIDNYDMKLTPNYIESFAYSGQSAGFYKTMYYYIDYSWENGYYLNRIVDIYNNTNLDNVFGQYIGNEYYNNTYIPTDTITAGWESSGVWNIDEYPEINDADYIRVSGAYRTAEYDFSDVYKENISSIDLYVRKRKIAGYPSPIFVSLRIDGIHQGWRQLAESTSWTTYKETFEITDTDIETISVVLYSGNINCDTRVSVVWAVSNFNDVQHCWESENNTISDIPYEISFENEYFYDFDYDNPVKYEICYLAVPNESVDLQFYIYNYDLGSYEMYFQENTTFFERNIELNQSGQFRFNRFKIFFNFTSYNQFLMYFKYIYLKITYIIPNELGYHEILAYSYRYTSADSYVGYSLFTLRIYNDSIHYKYQEINLYTDNYEYNWIIYDTSNIDLQNLELQCHVRYGLNTLDIEIVNFYYKIYLNYNESNVIEFREQSRKELTGQKIKSSFNYTSYTRNYVDLTGIIGNYSYNTFAGCRSLYGSTSEIFHRYFTVPFFNQEIDVSIPIYLPEGTGSNPDEPSLPVGTYWTYTTFKADFYANIPMNIGNWTINFPQMKTVQYTAKYPYDTKTYDEDDWGSWKWKIKFSSDFSYTISFNFMRNALCSLVNFIFLIWQWFGYFGLVALSYLVFFVGIQILVFIWNYMVYGLYYALITVLWYVYEGLFLVLLAVWSGLVWVYENLLVPFLDWFWDYLFPLLVEWFIIVIAVLITFMIYVMTLGQADWDNTYEMVYNLLQTIKDFGIEMLIIFSDHIIEILMFVQLYLILTLYCFVKFQYSKANGYVNRSTQLEKSFEAYMLPINFFWELCKRIYDMIPEV